MMKTAREIEDLAGSRIVYELDLDGSQGYNGDFFSFPIDSHGEGKGVFEFDLFLRENVSFGNGWAEFILVIQHGKSDWDAFPSRDFRSLPRRSWRAQCYKIPDGIGSIKGAKLVLNSENGIQGRILVSRPIVRDSSFFHHESIGRDGIDEIIGILNRNDLRIPSAKRLNDLAKFKFAAEKLPTINALRLGPLLPEEEAILRHLPNFKSILTMPRGGVKIEDETYVALPRFDQERRAFDIILINPLDRFELMITESFHSFHLLALNGLLVIHDAQLAVVNRVIQFLLMNRNLEFPCLTPPDCSNAIFSRKRIIGPRPWDHFEFF